MIAEFARTDRPDEPVGRVRWMGPGVRIESDDDDVRAAIGTIFRPTSVVVDDPSLRTAGTSGDVELPPGSLRWFLAAARTRAEPAGLKVSFVPSGSGAAGWDPAGSYRTFGSQVERIESAPITAGSSKPPSS